MGILDKFFGKGRKRAGKECMHAKKTGSILIEIFSM